MNPVQRLAAVECIGWTEGDGCSRSTECACQGTGRKYWQLWGRCKDYGPCQGSICPACQGAGYVLRPEAECEVVLMDLCSAVEIVTYPDYDYGQGFKVRIKLLTSKYRFVGREDTRLAALAAAIYQAQEDQCSK